MSKEVKLTGHDHDCSCGHDHTGQETQQKAISPIISEVVRQRLVDAGQPFHCNNNISEFISDSERDELVNEVTIKMEAVLRSLVIDIDNDHNTKDTARRVAKMYVNEIFSGRLDPQPKITAFPNAGNYDQIYISGPITVRSMCAHHMMPIVGKAYVGVYPGKKVIGLSKFNRIVDWICSRPQIQEELTVQVADAIEAETEADGVAIVMRAEHFCMTHRGVREHESDMTTSVMRGKFLTNSDMKQEFISLISQMK